MKIRKNYLISNKGIKLAENVEYITIYKNNWYSYSYRNLFLLFDSQDRLIADDLDDCYVYKNGWYKLKKNNKYSLYNSKQELIADNLDSCYVY